MDVCPKKNLYMLKSYKILTNIYFLFTEKADSFKNNQRIEEKKSCDLFAYYNARAFEVQSNGMVAASREGKKILKMQQMIWSVAETTCVRTLCKSQEDKKKARDVPYPKIIYKAKYQTKEFQYHLV